jgi:hypothetical protein
MKHTWLVKPIIIITCILLAIFIYDCQRSNDKGDITSWVNANGEVVKDINARHIHTGPYWAMKNYRYYRVETKENIYWVRYGWGRTIKQEISVENYKDIE